MNHDWVNSHELWRASIYSLWIMKKYITFLWTMKPPSELSVKNRWSCIPVQNQFYISISCKKTFYFALNCNWDPHAPPLLLFTKHSKHALIAAQWVIQPTLFLKMVHRNLGNMANVIADLYVFLRKMLFVKHLQCSRYSARFNWLSQMAVSRQT